MHTHMRERERASRDRHNTNCISPHLVLAWDAVTAKSYILFNIYTMCGSGGGDGDKIRFMYAHAFAHQHRRTRMLARMQPFCIREAAGGHTNMIFNALNVTMPG